MPIIVYCFRVTVDEESIYYDFDKYGCRVDTEYGHAHGADCKTVEIGSYDEIEKMMTAVKRSVVA